MTIEKGIFLILEARQKDNLVNKHEFTKLSTDYKVLPYPHSALNKHSM